MLLATVGANVTKFELIATLRANEVMRRIFVITPKVIHSVESRAVFHVDAEIRILRIQVNFIVKRTLGTYLNFFGTCSV